MSTLVTGSEGVVGSHVVPLLERRGITVERLDLNLGHDLEDPLTVERIMQQSGATSLINLFALNHHVTQTQTAKKFDQVTPDEISRFMDVNVVALYDVCVQFIKTRDSGSIVNLSSIYGSVSPRPSLYASGHKHPGYAISKAAVQMLTKYLAVHAAP